MSETLNIRRFLPETRVEGPGLRACLWVQGCSIRCKGCYVPGSWPTEGGQAVSVAEVESWVAASSDIEGITFMGGEPFNQAPALAVLGQRLQRRGLSVMSFSGFTYEQLKASTRAGVQALLAITDLLVAGPFLEEKLDTSRPWVGSGNQQFHFLSPRYEALQGRLPHHANKLEVRLRPDGCVQVNGLATTQTLAALFEGFRSGGE